jgi:hypothetical protein
MISTSGTGTVYPPGAPEFIPSFSEDLVDHFVVFYVIFWRPLFVFLSFSIWPLFCLSLSFGHTFVCLSHLAILLSVLLFMATSYKQLNTISIILYYRINWFGLWCLTPLSTILRYIVAANSIDGGNSITWRNHRPRSHRQTLSHNVVLSTPCHEQGSY